MSCFHISSEKESILKGENLLHYFPFRVYVFSEGVWCVGKQTETGSHKTLLSWPLPPF